MTAGHEDAIRLSRSFAGFASMLPPGDERAGLQSARPAPSRTRARLSSLLLSMMLLASVACLGRRTEVDTVRVLGQGGILVPGRGFLYLEVRETVEYELASGATPDAIERCRAVLFGQAEEVPEVVLRMKVQSASFRLMFRPEGGGAPARVGPEYPCAAPVLHGKVRDIREGFFDAADGWQAGDSVALPFGRLGEKRFDWAVWDSVSGALAPLAGAAGSGSLTTVRMEPGSGRRALLLPKDETAVVADLEGGRCGTPMPAWDAAWHPRLPCLYTLSGEGLIQVFPGGGAKPRVLAEGPRFRRLQMAPSGDMVLLEETGNPLWRAFALDAYGRPGLAGPPLPEAFRGADFWVWDPGGADQLWCFHRKLGLAELLELPSGRVRSVWKWPRDSYSVKALHSGASPTVILLYAPPGSPSWQKTIAYLNIPDHRFVGIDSAPPVERIPWEPAAGRR